MRYSEIVAVVDIATIRASPGGRELSQETLLLLAFLIDSMQIQDYSKRSHDQVIKDLNEAHTRIKTLLRNSDLKDKKIQRLEKNRGQHRLMLWIQGGALAGCWALALALLKIILAHH